MFRSRAMLLAAQLLLWASSAPAISIDFENFQPGTVVTSDQDGYTLTVDNFNKKKSDAAVAFEAVSTDRKDLRQQAGLADLGTILVLQDLRCAHSQCTNQWKPSGSSSGSFKFAFDEDANSLAFDLIGLNRGSIKKSSITFFDDSSQVGSFKLKDLIDPKSRLSHIVLELPSGTFDSFEIALRASGGGIDNIVTSRTAAVPEPGTAGIVGFGLVALAYAGRRRR